MLKDPNAKRAKPIKINFYVSEEEKQLIEQKFKESELPSRRSFYLCSILGNPIYIIDQTPVKEHTWELNKIGVNFNQLVKKLCERKLKDMFFAIEEDDNISALLYEGGFNALVEAANAIYGVDLLKYANHKGGIYRKAIHSYIHGVEEEIAEAAV